MNDGADFLPLACVVEALEDARRRADAVQNAPGVFRLSLDLTVFVEERGPGTFVRFSQRPESRDGLRPARLRITIGPGDTRQVSVEPSV